MLARIRHQVRRAKRDVVATYFAARDPETPLPVRVLAVLVAAYALSPIDLIPDFIPVLGLLDDLILVPLGLVLVIHLLPPRVLGTSRAKAEATLERPHSRVMPFLIVGIWIAGACILLGACASRGSQRRGAWLEAEGLFRQDPRWLGGDAALTIRLDRGRTLWLFGDSFVATSPLRDRRQSEMPRNTIAVQTGDDPRTASMEFVWRKDDKGLPLSWFPDKGDRWYWPGHGIRLAEGPLVVFLSAIESTPGKGLGFACCGYALAVVDDPSLPVRQWQCRVVDAPPVSFDAIPATAVLRVGEHVVGLAIRTKGVHAGALVRYPAADLARGELGRAEWWTDDGRGWVRQNELGPRGPTFVIDDAGAECSLHWDARTKSWLHVATYGFGATTIGLRSSRSLTKGWSQPVTVYRPPESDGSHPFVYAAKAHPGIPGPSSQDLVITYATNSFEFADLFTEQGQRTLYWPRFVLVGLGDGVP